MERTKKPNVVIFASGTKDGGGSGFANLIKSIRNRGLYANCICVVSNHISGGVCEKAKKLGIPFYYSAGPWTAETYQEIAEIFKADFYILSGWMLKVKGLDLNTRFNSKTVFNIHPGTLPQFGGKGMYGHNVHDAVWKAYLNGELTETEINMHFINDEFDRGPVFFKLKIPIGGIHDAEELGKIVNEYEHIYQPWITNLVVNKLISWDGINPDSLIIPFDYKIEQTI